MDHDCREHGRELEPIPEDAKFYLIWGGVGSKTPTVKFCEQQYAAAEAQRLASTNVGQTFTVLQAISKVGVIPVQPPVIATELK